MLYKIIMEDIIQLVLVGLVVKVNAALDRLVDFAVVFHQFVVPLLPGVALDVAVDQGFEVSNSILLTPLV